MRGVEDFVLQNCSCGEEKQKKGKPSTGVEIFVLCKLQMWGRKTKGGGPGKGALVVLNILSSKIAVVGGRKVKEGRRSKGSF